MTHFSQSPLQQAIYTVLAGDTTLQAMVSGVYDHVPQGSDYPFIAIGESSVSDWSNLATQGNEQQLNLRIFSRESGRKQAATIMERMVALLHHQAIAVSGQSLAQLTARASRVELMEDGVTYRGTLTLRALLNEA